MWDTVSVPRRRWARTLVILGFAQLFLVDVFFRYQQVPLINQNLSGAGNLVPDGVTYPPFVVSGAVCSVLIALSVILVGSEVRGAEAEESYWLGTAWLLVAIPLVLDLLIDSFEVKWPVIIAFAWVGFRYWNGVRNSSVGLVLAPAVAAIATSDLSFHSSGQGCPLTGLDSCSAKTVSDVYLVIMLIVLSYVTLRGWDKRPGRALTILALAIPAAVIASSVLGSLF